MKTGKFIALIIFMLYMCSCAQNIDKRGQNSNSLTLDELVKHRYKVGDVVYLKPDSIKVVIDELTYERTDHNPFAKCSTKNTIATYSLYYFRQDGMKNIERNVDEALIY